MRVAAVILAAGRSTRFGSAKPAATVAGRTLIEHVTTAAAEAGLEPIVAVVTPGAVVPDGAIAVENPRPEAGLSSSLRLGIGAVPAHADCAVVLLGDQPTVSAEHIGRLLEVARADAAAAVIATRARGVVAPPVLLRRSAFALAGEAEGDTGLSPLLAGQQHAVAYVEVDRHAPDIDTPDDLRRVSRSFRVADAD
jgi:molybdenum cofactor cytidylyltransferase